MKEIDVKVAAFGGTALSTNGSLGFYIPCVSYKVDVYLTLSRVSNFLLLKKDQFLT